MEGVKVENLTIGYGEPLVSGLSFHMKEGEFWVVVGPNGTGKSTLIKTLLGIIKPISGRILIHGKDCTSWCEERKYLSYVPQMENYSRSFPSTVFELVLSGLFPRLGRFQKIGNEEVEEVNRWLEVLELSPLKNRKFNQLSGGQQRKVLIARALVSSPHYIFLDEPTNGVDLKSSRKILKLLDRLHKEKGFGICMVTHEISTVWQYIDKVILLGYGGKFFIGNKEEILNPELLSEIYEVEVEIARTEAGPIFLIWDKH
ncbi:MAG: ABC transporter ATP-binding protein [Desulfurobacteriaceae bacterium]